MNPLAKRLLALASAAAITLSTIPAVHGVDKNQDPDLIAENWTMLETASLAEPELIPAAVRSVPTDAPLTRQGLCSMLMTSYKAVTGTTDEELGEPELVFIDTDDIDVLNAYHLDLISGLSVGIFEPEQSISRQDFFTVSVNLLRALGYPYSDDIEEDLSQFAESDTLMAYARQPVQVLLYIEAIDGTALEPERSITAEEAVVILDRVVSFYRSWLENPVEPGPSEGELVAQCALQYVGCRYVSGRHGPNKFDCSGLVYYVYGQFGYDLKPGAKNQWSLLDESVKKSELLPGDLVFFSKNGRYSGIFHVGIYIGDGEFVHAANSRKGVIVTELSDAWYANRYYGAKRVIS